MRVTTEEGKATVCLSVQTMGSIKQLEVATCRSFKDKEDLMLCANN